MTKKKSAAKPQAWLAKTGRKMVNCTFEPDDHQRVREAAAKSGLSMAKFAETSVLAAAEKILGKS